MNTSIKDQILSATDTLNAMRRAYYRQEISYGDMVGAARQVLELRQQAEKAFTGKIKTKINPISIASLLRSPLDGYS